MMTAIIEKDAGIIVGPIASVLGFIINLIFQMVVQLTEVNSLGFSIILLTIVVRTLMLPLAFKQQKSTIGMARLAPEVEKIKKKYGDTKDPELAKKMNMEIQALYTSNGVNLLGGCLPMLVTLPIFIALMYVMRQTYLYVPNISDIYTRIAETIQTMPNFAEVMMPIASPMVPNGMKIDIAVVSDLVRIVNKLTPDSWTAIIAAAPADVANTLTGLLAERANIETFFTINLVNNPALAWPSIIIPILSGVTQFLTFWLMEKTSPATEGPAKTQQTVMKFVMPAIMIYFTMTVSAGVGLYWTMSNIYQVGQQYFIGKFYPKTAIVLPAEEKRGKSKSRKAD